MKHRGAFGVVVVGVLFVGAVRAAAPDGDWPGYQGPRRDARSGDTGLTRTWPAAEAPKPIWTYQGLGAGYSTVAVAGGRIYATGIQEKQQMLFCLDLDGKEVWKVVQGPRSGGGGYPAARSTPTVDGNRVYVTGAGGRVTCHDTSDGKIVWTREMRKELGGKVGGWEYAESVLIHGDHAIVTPGGKTAIVALDKATGKDAWRSDVSAEAGYSSCIAVTEGADTLIVNGSQAGLLAVDAKTGKKVWTSKFAAGNTANTPTPAYSDGHLFWGVGYGQGAVCYEVTHADGGQWTFKEAWRSGEIEVHPGNYVIDKGLVYGKGKGGLACVDLKTGKWKWGARLPGGSLTMADGLLFGLGESQGKAWVAEPSATGCKILSQFKIAGERESWAQPVVTGGRWYLRYDTFLYCYDVKAK